MQFTIDEYFAIASIIDERLAKEERLADRCVNMANKLIDMGNINLADNFIGTASAHIGNMENLSLLKRRVFNRTNWH